MKNILIYAATGEYNLGDECIISSEVEYLKNRFPDAIITIASYDSRSTLLPISESIRHISYFPNNIRRQPFKNIGAFWKNLLQIYRSDLVIIGWGWIFYDTEAGQSFARLKRGWSLRIFLAQLFRKPIVFWSIGIDLTHTHLREVSWWFTYEKARVSVRDAYSKKLLEDIWVVANLIDDPVFLRLPEGKRTSKSGVSAPNGIDGIHPEITGYRNRVGLALRSGYLQDESDNVERIVRYLQAHGFEVIFLSHSLHPTNILCNDFEMFREIAERLHVAITSTMEETMELYPTLDFVISMRLHASILSVIHGIPFYSISYGNKTRSILQSLELSFIHDAKTFLFSVFRTQFWLLVEARTDAEFAIAEKSDTMRKDINSSLEKLFYGF